MAFKDYPTADNSRCYDCFVLAGQDHLNRCNSPAAQRARQEWLRENAKKVGLPDLSDYPAQSL